MFPFRGTERRAFRMPHGASRFPLSAEGVRRVPMPCEVLLPPASSTRHVSTKPSTVGSHLSHGARCDPAVPVGSADRAGATYLLASPSRHGEKSHRNAWVTAGCPRG